LTEGDLLAVRWMRARRVLYTGAEDTGKSCPDPNSRL